MRLRMASRTTRVPERSETGAAEASSFETQSQAGLLLRMRPWSGRSDKPPPRRHPGRSAAEGRDPGPRTQAGRAWAARSRVEPGMTERGGERGERREERGERRE